jgi:hypothetical protein
MSFLKLNFGHATTRALKGTSKEKANLKKKGDMRGLSF